MWRVDLNDLRKNSRSNQFSKMNDAAKRKYSHFIKYIQQGRSPWEAAELIGTSSGSNIEKLSGVDQWSIRLSQEHRATFKVYTSISMIQITSVGGHYDGLR